MPSTPISARASFTSSSLKGLMMAMMSFMGRSGAAMRPSVVNSAAVRTSRRHHERLRPKIVPSHERTRETARSERDRERRSRHPGVPRPRRDRRCSVGRARRGAAFGDAVRLEAYLRALHDSASAVARTGWAPHFLVVERAGELVAACPLYLKDHSYGEYVFDWAWADAYRRHGLDYYPKLLVAVPFTPFPGLACWRARASIAWCCCARIEQLARRRGPVVGAPALPRRRRPGSRARRGLVLRTTVQFHWSNRAPAPYADFADFLASLQRDKRKKIQQEQRRVAEAGVTYSVATGEGIARADWDFFYRCYTLTYRAHHSTPYLTRDFFARLAATMPENWLLFIAWRGGKRIAVLADRDRPATAGPRSAATGARSSTSPACTSTPATTSRWHGASPTATGASRAARRASTRWRAGCLPVQTWSAHWLAHPQFARAIDDFLAREGAGVAELPRRARPSGGRSRRRRKRRLSAAFSRKADRPCSPRSWPCPRAPRRGLRPGPPSR